jgi:hypothetical protein
MENLSQYSLHPSQDSKRSPPEDKSRALPLRQPTRSHSIKGKEEMFHTSVNWSVFFSVSPGQEYFKNLKKCLKDAYEVTAIGKLEF